MKYCPNCGAESTGTPYCGNCGHRIAEPTGVGARSGATENDSGYTLLRANPFTDIQIGDYVRDLVALVLLLISFGMPWDLVDTTTGKIYVILATLISIMSLALPYLHRAGVFPASWGNRQVRQARLLANAPYGVVVVVTLVLDYAGGADAEGVGVGLAFGLAGAILAAQPRSAERAPEDGALWRAITLGLGGVVGLLTLLTLVQGLIDATGGWGETTAFILWLALFAALIGLPVVGVARRDGGWRDALIVVGSVGILAGLWQLGADLVADAWRVETFGPIALLWPAIGASITAPGVEGFVDAAGGSARWVRATQRVLELTLVAAALSVVIAAVELAAFDANAGAEVTIIVLFLIIAAAALVARGALGRDARQGRQLALVTGGVMAVLGIVLAAVIVGVGMYDAVTLSAVFVFATAIIAMLTVPIDVRRELAVAVSTGFTAPTADQAKPASGGAATGAKAGDKNGGADAGAHDETAVLPPVDTPHSASSGEQGYDSQIASDPSTPLEVLADIAAKDPALRPYVAANPSTYPELLTWLGNLGDPAVDEALRGRS